jgi:hypothetical protein
MMLHANVSHVEKILFVIIAQLQLVVLHAIKEEIELMIRLFLKVVHVSTPNVKLKCSIYGKN